MAQLARIDYTSDTGGTFTAQLGQLAANARKDFDALHVDFVGETETSVTYNAPGTFLFTSQPCGPACAGLDAEAFGE